MAVPVFLWPDVLWLLLLIPLLVLAYIWIQRRRQIYALRYATFAMMSQAIGAGPGIRRHMPAVIILLALTSTIIGIARPQAVLLLPKREGTIILTIDVSGSMGADDIKPTRMEAAKNAARNFVQQQPQDVRIAVVSFTDGAFIVQAPTSDHDALITAINRLQPQRGTAIGRGLQTSLDAIFETTSSNAPPGATPAPRATPTPPPNGEHASAIIILLTDGENNIPPEPVDVAREIARLGVRVFTVGVGTAEGAVLHVEGRTIRTRLDEAMLRQIADMTDGEYYRAKSEQDLRDIYNKVGADTVWRTEKTEITYLFTSTAIVLVLIAGILSLLWFNRLP